MENKHPAVTFLKALYTHCEGGGFVNLRFLPIAKNYFLPLAEIDRSPSVLGQHPDQNAHFGVALRENGNGTKGGIVQIPALWVDLDLGKLSDEEKEKVSHNHKDFPLLPSLVINSGGGRHLYWKLKEPATKEEILKVEELNRRLAAYFRGDMMATDASRLMRLPGTTNFKYNPPRKVTFKDFNSTREYNLSDFDFLPPLEFSASVPEDSRRGVLGAAEGERNNSLARFAGKFFAKGFSFEETLAACRGVNLDCKPPLEDAEVVKIVKSIQNTHQRNHPENGKQQREDSQRVNYKLTTLADIFNYSKPTFLIEPILVEGAVSILGAYTGAGKSMVTLSIIKSVLTGTSLWGKYSVNKTGPVLLIDEETPQGFLRERIEKFGFNQNLPLHFLHFQGVRLDKDNYFDALMNQIQEVKPVLVVIDSLIRVHRGKEDEAWSIAPVMEKLRKIANTGTSVWVIHHHKKGEADLKEKLRGSSDIPGGVDIEYALTPKDGYLIFSSVKTRIEPLVPIRLKMTVTEGKIEILYQGGEHEEVIKAVADILLDTDEMGIKEIRVELQNNGLEVRENTLRDILKRANNKELIMRVGDRGKQLFHRNPAWQFGSHI